MPCFDVLFLVLKTLIQTLFYGRAAPCRWCVPEIIRCSDWSEYPIPALPAPVLVGAHLTVMSVYPECKHQTFNVLCQKNRNVTFKTLALGLLCIIQMSQYAVCTDPQWWRTRRPTWQGLSAPPCMKHGSDSCCVGSLVMTSLKVETLRLQYPVMKRIGTLFVRFGGLLGQGHDN